MGKCGLGVQVVVELGSLVVELAFFEVEVGFLDVDVAFLDVDIELFAVLVGGGCVIADDPFFEVDGLNPVVGLTVQVDAALVLAAQTPPQASVWVQITPGP